MRTMFNDDLCPGCGYHWTKLPVLHFCAQAEPACSPPCPSCGQPKGQGYGCAAAPETVQDAHSGPTAAVTPTDGPKHCIVCQQVASALLTVVPTCYAHGSPDALERALAEARAELHDVIGGLQSAQALIVTWAKWLRFTFPKELEVGDEEQALLDYAAALLAAGE